MTSLTERAALLRAEQAELAASKLQAALASAESDVRRLTESAAVASEERRVLVEQRDHWSRQYASLAEVFTSRTVELVAAREVVAKARVFVTNRRFGRGEDLRAAIATFDESVRVIAQSTQSQSTRTS